MRWVLATLIVVTGAHVAAAQDPQVLLPIYRDAVRNYQFTHSLEGARRLVGIWSRSEFESASGAEAQLHDRARIEAAAVFHLEIALDAAPQAPDGAQLHIRLGERLLEGRNGSPNSSDASRGRADEFGIRWYAAASSVFLAQTDLARTRVVLGSGLARWPNATRLIVLSGIVEDMDAQSFDAEYARNTESLAVINRLARRHRVFAERAYRRAIELDPLLLAPRIRLGRLLFLLNRLPESREWLERARSDAVATADRYLVRLFLSDVHRRSGNIDTARAVLEEALALAPDRQTAYVALAQLEEREGRVARARAIVTEGLARRREPVRDEWWDFRNGAVDEEGFAWLRGRVHR